MSSQSSMLIREPNLRWPIYLLAAIITAVIMLVTAVVMQIALTQPAEKRIPEPRLQGLIRPGMPEFQQFREKIIVEDLVAFESTQKGFGQFYQPARQSVTPVVSLMRCNFYLP